MPKLEKHNYWLLDRDSGKCGEDLVFARKGGILACEELEGALSAKGDENAEAENHID